MYLKETIKFVQENLILTCSIAWNVALYILCVQKA